MKPAFLCLWAEGMKGCEVTRRKEMLEELTCFKGQAKSWLSWGLGRAKGGVREAGKPASKGRKEKGDAVRKTRWGTVGMRCVCGMLGRDMRSVSMGQRETMGGPGQR